MPSVDRPLITRRMVGLFVIVFLVATLARLPASVMLPYLANGGIKAAGADGTVWHARFNALSFQAMKFDRGAYQLNPSGFFTDTEIGAFSLIGDIAAMQGKLHKIENDRIHLADLSVNAQYPLPIGRLKLTPRIRMQTEELVISQDGQCAVGEIILSLQLNNPLLTGFLPQADLWDGNASCDNGRADFLPNPRDSSLVAVIRGKLTGNRYQADIDLSLEDGFDDMQGLETALKSAGFRKRQGRWRAEITGTL